MSFARPFLLLVCLQAAHSAEEFAFGLYDLLPYFRPFGAAAMPVFAVGNALVVALGAWCYRSRVRSRAASAEAWAWGWCVVELANGILHPTWTLLAGHYIPGTATAPLLLATSIYLMSRLGSAGPSTHAIQDEERGHRTSSRNGPP